MNDSKVQEAIAAFEMPKRVFSAMPYAWTMGFDLVQEGDKLLGRLRHADHLIGNPRIPALHGGAIATLLQLTAAAQVMAVNGSEELPRLFSFTVEYLASPKLRDTLATATIISRSRRFANVRVSAFQETPDSIIAAATVQFVLVE